MINHYRTLLLNLVDQGNPNEYIAPGFNPIILPTPLADFYNLLYPSSSSRYYKEFLAYYCENLIRSTDQPQFLYSFDKRITYDLSNLGDYFATNRLSNPSSSNSNFSLFVSGNYILTSNINSYYEGFQINQIGSTSNVLVYSTTRNLYINGNQSSASPINMAIPLSFTNGVSNSFAIGATGVIAQIAGVNFTSTSNKIWTFIAEAPFSFSFTSFYNSFILSPGIINPMLAYGAIDVSSQNIWQQHFNTVYQLAGLFNAYIVKVNACLT